MICNFYKSSLPIAVIHPLAILRGKTNFIPWHKYSTYGKFSEFKIVSVLRILPCDDSRYVRYPQYGQGLKRLDLGKYLFLVQQERPNHSLVTKNILKN